MAHPINPSKNQLLTALPEADWRRWAQHVDIVSLGLGQVLYEAGDTLTHAYFPIDSIISLLYVMKDGESAEIAVVGHEGVVGIALFMGGDSTPSRAIVQNAGQSYRISAKVLRSEFNNAAPVLHLLLRYTQALITQMTQTAACNKHHSLQQQLCRWILLSLDRLASDNLTMTQQLMANMLGVSLKTMNEGGRALQDKGVIRYADGHITVLDRAGLEKLTCECYGVVKKEYDRLLPDRQAA
jgi:CRP-like cAMP-binding protein